MDEQFFYDFRTGCGNSAKFARIFDMGFTVLPIYTIFAYLKNKNVLEYVELYVI